MTYRKKEKQQLFLGKIESFSEDALTLSGKTFEALHPLLKEYQAKGYDIRAICHVMFTAVFDLELSEVIEEREK